ncbi:hypothetical protein BG011_007684 [Mortierella polycephala]|uniref:RdRp catalytic domain-containing protein n=1 Tax=Mortierella polycephala TaxID=41804 RepID=A0A9P6QET9_9FUNG|nr:hypothetical protein BG011_007684 [Mortierella polycephala]
MIGYPRTSNGGGSSDNSGSSNTNTNNNNNNNNNNSTNKYNKYDVSLFHIPGITHANPINRNTIMETHRLHNEKQRADIAQIEQSLMQMTLRTPFLPGRKIHRGPPLFDKRELLMLRHELQSEFIHFTFYENKRFYKPMDKMLDFVEQDPLLVAYSKMNPPPLPADLDLSKFEYAKPCSMIQMNHLRLFNRLSKPGPPSQYQSAFRRAARHVAALMRLPEKLPMPTEDSLPNVRYDGTKFAGLDYARMKLKKRSEAHPVALVDATETWQSLLCGTRVAPHDTRLGGKGKLIERSEYGKVTLDDTDISMGRLILMLSHRDLLILGALEQPLTKSYLDDQWPIHIGHSWYHGGAEQFVNKMSRHAVYHCFDAKKFDAAIDGWLVREAILILRDQFEGGMDPKYNTLWAFVYESLIDVVICRDDGIRMQKHVGTTSGNCFNTLVQSIITMFLGYTSLIVSANERLGSIGVEMVLQECKLDVLGDDTVLALETTWAYLTKETLAKTVKDCFNIDWSGKKSFSTRSIMDDSIPNTVRFQGVQFLGMYFRHQRWGDSKYAPKVVIPYRPFRESYLSLLFPKYGEYSREHSWLRAIGIYLNAAGNNDTQVWLEKYMDFLELVPFVRPEAWPPGMVRMVTRDYWGLGTKPPLPARISIDEWLRLICLPRQNDE